MQSWTDQLWNLLPSFCRYPIDVHHSFGSLSKLLVEISKCDDCLYKSAVKALQVWMLSYHTMLFFCCLLYRSLWYFCLQNYKDGSGHILYIFFIVSQQLVDGTRRLSTGGQDVEINMELSALFSSKPDSFKCARLDRCSKKDARKNLKVLASHSTSLLCTFTDYFLDSSPEKRAHLKVHLLISFNFLIGYLWLFEFLSNL